MGTPKHKLLFLAFVCLFSSPTFSATYYVSTTGNNSNDGLSEMNAWLTITYAVTQVSAGDIVYVKAGNYGAENVLFSTQGTSGNPIIIQGYQTTPGDSPSLTYSPGTALDPAVMPLLSGANNAGRAFDLSAYDYIEIRNFQIEDYTSGIYANNSDNITVDNVIGVDFGTWNAGGSEYGVFISGTNNTIDNSIMTDAGVAAFWVQGGSNTIQNCKAYGHMEGTGNDFTHYYYVVKSNGNTVTNCLADEVYTNLNTNAVYYYYLDGNSNNVTDCTATNPAVESEASFGFAQIGGNANTFTNCTANFIDAGFYLTTAANNNTYNNCTVNGDGGFVLRNGANANNFNSCKTDGCIFAMRFQETEGTYNPCVYSNTFTNCLFQNTTGSWLDFNTASSSADNNKWINCTIVDSQYLFDDDMPSSGNEMINCIVAGMSLFVLTPQTHLPGFSYKNCNFYSSADFPTFPGFPVANPDTTNLMQQPPIFVDEAGNDFHLKLSSPCIDAGTATDAPSTDYDGDSRPMGDGIDMGYDETSYTQTDCFYVTTAGNNLNDGLTEATAWQTMTYGLSQIAAGDTLHVKAGTYNDEKINFDRSGLPGKPIVFFGYQNTIGIDPDLNYQVNDPLDPAVMPLMESTDLSGRAFDVTNESHLEIRNFQIKNYKSGVHSETGAEYVKMHNLIGTSYIDETNFGIYYHSNYGTITDCIMIDFGYLHFYLNNSNNLIDNCQSYRITGNGGYHYRTEGSYNVIQNSIAKLLHPNPIGGHGFGTRNGPNNTFNNCEATGITYPFYCRWPNSAYNTFNNCTVYEKNGLVVRDGAHHNTFNNCKVINGDYGIGFFDSVEFDQNDPCAYDNTFNNCTFYNVGTVFNLSYTPGNYQSTVQNNKIINCTAYNADNLFMDEMPSNNNDIINCIFEDVDLWLNPANTGTQYPLDFSFQYCNLYDTPAWPANPDTANILQLPPIFVDKANGDLHLAASSPLIDQGTATNAPTTDFEGDARPQGNEVDMGADETPYTESDVFYVSLTGNDSNDGLTEGTAWRTITHASNSVVEGDLVHVKAGNYGDEKIDFPYSGRSGMPITFRGYQTTPGDNPVSTYQPGDALDPNLMPLLVGSDTLERAFDVTNRDYLDLRNFQISAYQSAVHSEAGSDNNYFSNIIGVRFGRIEDLINAFGFYLYGTNNTIENCIITDAGNYCYFLAENNNTINNCIAYGNEYAGNEVDYYFHIYGDYNTIQNCTAKELYTTLGHDSGHGIGARGGANNTFINCEAHDLNYPIYARWSGAANNTFTNCRVYGGNGLIVRDGAHHNTFNACKVYDSVMGIRFQDSTEDGGQNDPCAHDNTFNNCLFQDVTGNMFDLGSTTYNSSVTDNKFVNCTMVSPHNLFKDLMPSSGNEITNCIITDVDNFIQLGNGTGQTLNFSFESCDYYNSDAIPGGISLSNMIYTDPLFVNAASDDYHIQNSSPCSNAGTSTDAPSTDFEGDPRPYGGGYDIGYDENTAVLYIELAEFYAIPKEEEVLLKWATQTENNNDYFVIQKSKNAIDWEDLEKIVGAGNSYEKINYSYPDRNPYSGTSYYRLKYFDYDGEFEYSRIAPVKFGADNTIVFYPNPVKDRLIIEKEEDTSIEIFNLIGVKMLETTSSVINVSKFESGTYLLILKDEFGNSIGFERFLKS
jgi:hypothetical protein